MLRLFVLVLWAILMPLSALAADFYFAVDGDDLATCTRDEPCQSLVKAGQLINQANPGDTFHFQGGDTFDGGHDICISAQNIDGKRDRPITLTSYGKGRAIFVNCKPVGIRGARSDWWVVEHLEIRDSDYGLRCLGCQDWLVQHNVWRDLGHVCASFDSFPRDDLSGTPAARIRLRHNACYETGLNGHGEGFYFYPGLVEDVVMEHNELFNLRDEGVNCKGNNRDIVVRNNYFHDFYPPLATLSPDRGLFSRLAHRVTQWLLPPARAGQNASEDTAINCRFENDTDILVERNLIENMPYAGVTFRTLKDVATQYNLIVGSGVVAISYIDIQDGHIDFNTIYNNHRAHHHGGVSVDNDINWGNTLDNEGSDPKFVDAAGGDFNLAAGSDRRTTGSDGHSQGVFHSPAIKLCSVRDREPDTVRCTVHPIRFPPLRCPDPTAFQVIVNGRVRDDVTRCRVASDTVIRLDLSGAPITARDTVKLSAEYGALQDSAWIGGRTPKGDCLAGLFTCNSLSLAINQRRVNNKVN